MSLLWVITIPIGLPIGLLIYIKSDWIYNFLDGELSLTAAACVTIGMIVGLFQWIFLRNYFAKSLVWSLSTALGIGLGVALMIASDLIDHSGFISAIVVSLVYAVVTGFTLSWMPLITRNKVVDPVSTP